MAFPESTGRRFVAFSAFRPISVMISENSACFNPTTSKRSKENMQRGLTIIFLSALLITFAGCQEESVPPSRSGVSETANTSGTAPTNQAARLSEAEAALLDAAVKGDAQRVKNLLDKGVNVNVKDQQGATPLAHAAWFGYTETVKLLIERGADVNAKKTTPEGSTVLQLATMRGHKDIIELLKQAGAK